MIRLHPGICEGSVDGGEYLVGMEERGRCPGFPQSFTRTINPELMGKQFQVFLLPDDVEALVAKLRETVGVYAIGSRSESPTPTLVASPLRTQGAFVRVDCFLVPRPDASVQTRHIASQGYWSVDGLFSDVIEFSGCHYDKSTLKRGRMFYDTGFYKDVKWQDKPKEFLDWAKTVFSKAKSELKFDRDHEAYVGPLTNERRANGGVLLLQSFRGQPPVTA